MPFSESLRMVLDTKWFLTEIIQRLQFALIRVHIGWNDFLRDVTTNTYTFPKKIKLFCLNCPSEFRPSRKYKNKDTCSSATTTAF